MSGVYPVPCFRALLIAGCGLFAQAADASGHLPAMPIEPRHFAGIAECRSFLDETYRTDLAKADAAPVPTQGGTAQTLIDSKGPLADGPVTATYTVTQRRQFRRVDTTAGQVTYSFNYETTRMQCEAGALTGTIEKGYYLDRRVPLLSDNPEQ